jgi:hypothetical protein
MKLKAVEVSFELIQEALTTGHETQSFRIIAGVPEGAKLVRVDQEGNLQGDGWRPDCALLYFEHESFADLEPTSETDRIRVTAERLAPRVEPQPGSGSRLIADERTRQVEQEGFSAEHDDAYSDGALLRAGRAYLDFGLAQLAGYQAIPRPTIWPWALEWWKPAADPIRNLTKAGALIAAEIDRAKRARLAAAGCIVRRA